MPKLVIPAPAPKESHAFVQTMKVCIAAVVYGVNVTYSKAHGEANVQLEIPKESKALIEPNAIVRYFAQVGENPHKRDDSSLAEDALIEWEESFLRYAFQDRAKAEDVLQSIEVALSATPFTKSFNISPSPAEIILFSTLYSPISSLPSALLTPHPLLKTWFFESALTAPWALSGIEKAAAETSEVSPKDEKKTEAAPQK